MVKKLRQNLNVLFITPDFPYPLNSGNNVAVFHRIQELNKRGHNVYLFSISTSQIEEDLINEVKKHCKYIKTYKIETRELIFNICTRPLMPWRIAKRYSEKFKEEIKLFLKLHNIDVIIIEHSITAPYLPNSLSLCKKVIVFHSLVYKSLLRMAKNLSLFSWRKYVFLIEALKTYRFEKKVLTTNRFDEFWFYSVDDICDIKNRFFQIVKKVKFIPIGISLKWDPKISKKFFGINPLTKVILLIGSMDNPSNEDAARWFAKKIFPKIKKALPEVKFYIVGKNSKYKLKDIASKDIIIVGEVPDIKPWLNICDLYVVPQRGGAGMRVKLLDGLSAKKVIITTSVGIEAIENIRPNFHLLLARNEEEFAQKAIEVLKNPEKFERIAKNGFNFIKENFSQEIVGDIVENCLLELVKSRRY